jgi:hypothetical protein
MLSSDEFGYAVMTRDLKGISLSDRDIEICKRYCRGDSVIVERIPVKCGIAVSLLNIYPFTSFHKIKSKDYLSIYILWFNISFMIRYKHRTGKVVYDPTGILRLKSRGNGDEKS